MFPVFSPRAQSTWHTSPSISRHASWSSGPGHSLGTRSDIIYIICNIYNMYNCTTCIISIISVIQVSLSLFNNKNHVDLSDYWKSGTWDIIEVPAYLNVNNNTGEARVFYILLFVNILLVRAAAAAQMGSGLQHIILHLLEPCPCLQSCSQPCSVLQPWLYWDTEIWVPIIFYDSNNTFWSSGHYSSTHWIRFFWAI